MECTAFPAHCSKTLLWQFALALTAAVRFTCLGVSVNIESSVAADPEISLIGRNSAVFGLQNEYVIQVTIWKDWELCAELLSWSPPTNSQPQNGEESA